MNNYELALILNAKVEDEARTATLEKVKEYITRFGGEISDIDEWGRKRLAYEIQKMNEGYYYFIHFNAKGDVVAQVENRLRIMENILRFLCVRSEK